MDKYLLYRLWSPDVGVWSRWVKPVPFAHYCGKSFREVPALREKFSFSWLAEPLDGHALVIDIPGAEGVLAGIALARRPGFRPVPIFSSCMPDSASGVAAVQTESILAALAYGGPEIDALGLPANAPPAFIIDALRRGSSPIPPQPGVFDNRSAIFASDFPSAKVLQAHGIHTCVVIRDRDVPMEEDLTFSLLPWRKAGVRIELAGPDGSRSPLFWPPGGFLGAFWHRFWVSRSLRPNARGGYGRFVPESSGG